MTVENITRDFELDATRDMLLQSFTEGTRSALASIRAAVEMLASYPDCGPDHRDRFIQIINEEVGRLSDQLHQLTADHADSLKTRWPLEEMLGIDVIDAAQRRIETRLGLDGPAGRYRTLRSGSRWTATRWPRRWIRSRAD